MLADLLWVVTPSTDGSHDIAAQACRELGGKLLSMPPGLYPAWNAGIREIHTGMTYISTVGEEITPGGLVTMAGLLRKHAADLCFSPPAIVPAKPEAFLYTRHWPVFRFAGILESYDRQLIPVSLLAALQTISGISGMFGSCASCIFATAALQSRPFPADFHHYGDTAWFYAHLCHLRVVFCKEVWSTFHVHDFSHRRIDPLDLWRCVDRLSYEYRLLAPSSRLPEKLLKLHKTREILDQLRKPHPLRYWWMNPVAWFWRFYRELLIRRILRSAMIRDNSLPKE